MVIRIKWDVEEAIALFDLYFTLPDDSDLKEKKIAELSKIYNNRARILGLEVDEKFRNKAGIKMQLACIQYVVTNGKYGLSDASELFYQTHKLYKEYPQMFHLILHEFYRKYSF